MNKLLIRINIFLFLIWAQFLVFVISLILASYVMKFLILPFIKILKIQIYDGMRMSLSFLILTSLQWFYRRFVLLFLKQSFLSALTLISSQIISIFMIEKILTRTIFVKYQLSYVAIFICLFLPFLDYFIASFQKKTSKY